MPTAPEWFATYDGAGGSAARLVDVVGEKLGRHHVLLIRNVAPAGDALDFWQEVGSALGTPQTTVEDGSTGAQRFDAGVWQDVRFMPDRPDSYRYHNVGQPLHTDGAYFPDSGDVVLFYMAKQARAGGASLFLDADTLAAMAEAEAPELFQLMTTVPVRFGKQGAERTISILHRVGGRLKINWNYYRVLPDQGETVARLRETFQDFLKDLVDGGRVVEFIMRDGDVVIFRDQDVLHGRKEYAAQNADDRLLWKSYYAPPTPGAEA
jgi:alpha-ketoglutarate-dependent taurine dioxygenase